MKDSRKGECLWSEWSGEGYRTYDSSTIVFYTEDHVDVEHEVVKRALASALQRDGVVHSLGDAFKKIENAKTSYGQCLKWALENKQIHGVWGGKDEGELRRALSVSYTGQEVRRKRFPNCPHCGGRPNRLRVVVADSPEGGRWTKMKLVVCDECQFVWRSRTSANAVTAYHSDREMRDEKKKNEKEKAKAKKAKRPKPVSQPST